MSNITRRSVVGVAGAALTGAATAAITTGSRAAAAPGVASRPLRITVAAKDAPAYIKDAANYVCTGTNDHLVINQAITAAATGPVGGSSLRALNAVELSGGEYYCGGSVLLRSGVDVAGPGPYASVLRAVNLTAATGAGPEVGLVKLADLNTHGCGIHGVTLEGGGAAGGTCDGLVYSNDTGANPGGYPYTSPDPDCYAYDLFVEGFRSPGVGGAGRNGLHLASDMRGSMLHTAQIRSCSGDGVRLTDTPDSHIDRIHVGGVDGWGFNISGGNNKVTNSKAYYANLGGMRLNGGRCTYTCLEAQDSVVGFDISAACALSGITADTSQNDGIIIRTTGVSLQAFQILWRSGARYPSQARGITFINSPAETTAIGRVNTNGIATKVSGTPGANSFTRIAGGTMSSTG